MEVDLFTFAVRKSIFNMNYKNILNRVVSALIVLVVLLLESCDTFEVHPYDGKIVGETNINAKNIKLIEESTKGQDTLRFAFISDSQRWYDELENFVKHINQDEQIDFIIHGGDIADFGLTKEFLWQRDILNGLRKPYVVVIGNHDYLANGDEVFTKVFGDLNFSFIAANTKFLGLNTNALETNYSVPIPNFDFIKKEQVQNQGEYSNTVVLMHAQPTSEQFNNNVSDLFQYSLNQFPNLLFCAHGHGHNYLTNDIFGDGIIYYQVPNIGKCQYFLFTITNDTYTHELISY